MSAIYRGTMSKLDKIVPIKLQPFWNHAAGPKTVFFWAPVIKWGLVAASIGDMTRPADQLSMQQSAALACTGIIWSRYSLVIKPKNWGLFSVNLFVGFTNLYHCYRAYKYQQSLKMAQIA